MKYDPSKQSLTMETAERKVNISFSVTPKETSIWHYVCTALILRRLFKWKRPI